MISVLCARHFDAHAHCSIYKWVELDATNCMAESVAATASPKALLFEALRPHPGIGILKSWPGAVEMILRGTATVSVAAPLS